MSRALPSLLILICLPGCLSFYPERQPDTPAEARFVAVQDAELHYEDSKHGQSLNQTGRPVVVLLHGFGSSTHEWRHVRPKLEAAGYRVVAVDLKGHGWSTRPAGDYSIEAHATLVLEALDQLKVERFYLLGHSWGSAVALATALKAPERVERIALFNGMFFDDQQPTLFHWSRVPGVGELLIGAFFTERLHEKMEHSVYDPDVIELAAVERVEEQWNRPGARAAALATIRAIDYQSLEAGYENIKARVLLVWGREDHVTPLVYGERMLKLLPNARLQVIPQCGHAPAAEAAALATGYVTRFFGQPR
jgi:pimeloyl-ACP methyl ester carboxylesterase